MKKIDFFIFTIFLLLTFLLRFSTLFQSYIEWDEGLYMLMSRSLLHGNPPYTEIWDNKPPGIYLLFSLAFLILGDSVFSIRIFTCITIAITCYLLYLLGKAISKNNFKIGIVAGFLYLIYCLQTDGLAGNTEIFFIPFVTFAFYLFLSDKNCLAQPNSPKRSSLFAIGLLFGISLQIKQVVLFDFLALIIILVISLYSKSQTIKKSFFSSILKACLPLSIGIAIPLFTILLYFIINNHFSDYFYANFYANIIRVGGVGFSIPVFLRILTGQIIRNLPLWLCLFMLPIYLLIYRKKSIYQEENISLFYLIIWFLMAFTSVLLLKGVYDHYYLQILPPLCLISAFLIIKTVGKVKQFNHKLRSFILFIIILHPLFTTVLPYIFRSTKSVYIRLIKTNELWGDKYQQIANYLYERVDRKKDYIYVADLPPIVYFLVDAKIPTKYAYSLFLADKIFATFPGVNSIRELNSIMSKNPIYVLRDRELPRPGSGDNMNSTDYVFYSALDSYLQRDYVFEKSINGVDLYKLRNPKPH